MTQKPVFMEGILTLRNLRSMGAAAVIEIVIAFGVAGILVWHQLQSVTQPPLILDPVVPDSPPQIPPLQHTVPTPEAPDTPQLSEVPAVPETIPSATTPPLQPPQLPVQPSQVPVNLAAEFGSSMLRAINDQKVYPKVALLKGEIGETVVSFDYVGGVVSNIHVDRSSGFHDLDEAAVQAVQRAALPAKPAALANLNHFVFHLAFSLGG